MVNDPDKTLQHPDTGTGQPNRRRALRQRVLKGGRILMHDGSSSVEVVIRDLSETGARLKLQDTWLVPRDFDLLILNPNSGRPVRHRCERRWQRGGYVGVRFIDWADTRFRAN